MLPSNNVVQVKSFLFRDQEIKVLKFAFPFLVFTPRSSMKLVVSKFEEKWVTKYISLHLTSYHQFLGHHKNVSSINSIIICICILRYILNIVTSFLTTSYRQTNHYKNIIMIREKAKLQIICTRLICH